ncbi:elongation factor Ts [Lachnospiraceae bacterium]|nr:elongation factor Ts [Lachnospiraceae bacterium]
MDNFQKVEKLREHANVSYEEAKQALENSNWDILDAMIYLEQNGKVHGPEQASYTTQSEKVKIELDEKECKSTFSDNLKRFGDWCLGLFEKGNNNSFCVEYEQREIFRVPITLLVVLLFFSFWVVVPLLVIGLFFDMRYHFAGPNVRSVDIDLNKAMDSAADAAESIKNEFSNTAKEENK